MAFLSGGKVRGCNELLVTKSRGRGACCGRTRVCSIEYISSRSLRIWCRLPWFTTISNCRYF